LKKTARIKLPRPKYVRLIDLRDQAVNRYGELEKSEALHSAFDILIRENKKGYKKAVITLLRGLPRKSHRGFTIYGWHNDSIRYWDIMRMLCHALDLEHRGLGSDSVMVEIIARLAPVLFDKSIVEEPW